MYFITEMSTSKKPEARCPQQKRTDVSDTRAIPYSHSLKAE
jgi:hypothetical protein